MPDGEKGLPEQVIRWGIWGAGAVAHSVASDFRLARGAVLHAVASRTPERAQDFGLRHGVARCYGGIEPLLNDAEVDVVYVATPNFRHVGDCLAVIQAGKAVLCEKPFALNLAQAQQIVNAARQRKVFCMEAMWTRFIPAVMEAKKCINAGAIGSIRMIQGNFAYPVRAGLEARFFNAELGGGALLDRGVYLISLAQHLLGAPQSVRGAACLGRTGVDEQSAYQLVYAGGALADLAASFRVRGTNEVIIAGESGLLRLCEPFYCAHRFSIQSHGRPRTVAGEVSGTDRGAMRGIMAGLRDAPAIRSLRRRLSPLEDVMRRGRVQAFPFAGNGYQFELLHVSHCLRQHRTESEIMPLDDSLDVMRTMDTLHLQMGVVHPIPGTARC